MSYTNPFTGNVIQPTDVSYRAIALTADTQLAWPINGNATEDYAARIMDVTPSGAGLSLAMPPGNQTSVGTDALITNRGAYTFTVTKFGLVTTIISIAPGESWYIYLSDNTTEGGSWDEIAFGIGTSAPNASALAGSGLVASGSTLNQSHPSSTISDGASFTNGQRAQIVIWNGGAGNVYLPAASSVGANWFILFKNSGTGTVTVNASGLDTIDSAPTKNFDPQESAFIVCTGSGYLTVGYGRSSSFQFTALVKPVTSGTYNLTTQEISNTIQEYTGSLSGNVTAVYPQVVNLYVIANRTTPNGHTLTITTGAVGGASVSIPANNQVTLVCDGVNFFNANTTQAGVTTLSMTNGSVGAPALYFASETSTGVYRPGSGEFAISILGSEVLMVDANGINVTGSGTFSAGISGGTFV